ncbi:MAG: acyltransferase [Candidatus Eremiobacteraeota bacterium]|nr:acyltransferase [Candidatus Eremiobacteraeota bacterium]
MRALGRYDLKPLTSLRFVAALLVFVYHAPLAQPFAREHALGQAGVGFFFLLSGFILTYTYRGALSTQASVVRFYTARFARVYPAYLVSIALALPVVALYGSLAWDKSPPAVRADALIAQVLAVQAWFPREEIYLGLNSPAWSISVEAFFYALFPLLIWSLSRSFATAGARTIFVMAAMTWACAAAVFAIPHHADVWTTYIFPPVRVVDFVVGMLLGMAFLRGYELPGSATAWEVAAVIAIAAAIIAIPHVPAGLQYSLWPLPFWAALIAIVALRRGAISRLLSHPAFVRLGEISYAFYLVHLSVLMLAEHVLPAALVSAVALATSLATAWGLHVSIERPLRAAIRGRVAPRAVAAA